MTRCSKLHIRFSTGVYLYMAVLILLMPFRWLIALAVSSLVHELCHLLAIRLCGVQVYSIRIGATGARIRTPAMTNTQELICALAGPLGGFSLLLFRRWLPATAICAAFQSLYNLLPIYPSDGGRALLCGVRTIASEERAEKVCYIIQTVFLILVGIVGLYGSIILHLDVLPTLIAVALIISTKKNSLQSG